MEELIAKYIMQHLISFVAHFGSTFLPKSNWVPIVQQTSVSQEIASILETKRRWPQQSAQKRQPQT